VATEGDREVDERDASGRVVLVGAPLGNPADASARFASVLGDADVIAAEDTRRLFRLARELKVPLSGRIVSYFEGNEERRTPELIEAARAGATVALVTDAGMPGVSDPGYRLVRAALDAGITVTAAPGPSAVTTALALSGLPSDRFCFEGFLPRRPAERRARLVALAAEPRTIVLFESTHRIAAALSDAAEAFGADRPAALCRELTKTYEQVRRATLGELASWASVEQIRGELTVVVGGARSADRADIAEAADPAELVRSVAEMVDGGTSRKEAIVAVARRRGLPRRVVYDAVARSRTGSSSPVAAPPDRLDVTPGQRSPTSGGSAEEDG
jgi:16S rRNA (cytidine1402-2'-O)-methyltransferase